MSCFIKTWTCPICEKVFPEHAAPYNHEECDECGGRQIRFLFAPPIPIFAWYVAHDGSLFSSPVICISHTDYDGTRLHDLNRDGVEDYAVPNESDNFIGYYEAGEKPDTEAVHETVKRREAIEKERAEKIAKAKKEA